MKIVVSFLIFTTAVVFAHPANDKHKEMALALMTQCQKQEGATEADVNALMTHGLPTSKEGVCIIACVNEKIGIFADGKFSKTGFIEASKMMLEGDEKLMKVAMELSEECAVESADRCEMGLKFETCLTNGVKARNLEIDFL